MTHSHPRPHRAAFTLIEAMFTIVVIGTAATACLWALASSLSAADTNLEETIASGIASQILDEMQGKPIGTAIASVVTATNRNALATIGDYNGYVSQPPTDPYGIPLGTDNGSGSTRDSRFAENWGRFANWKVEVEVYYVLDSDFTQRMTSGTSRFVAADVTVLVDDLQWGWRPRATEHRVFADVPMH